MLVSDHESIRLLFIMAFAGVAPVKSYVPNSYGLYNMLGNTWEWVAGGTNTEVHILPCWFTCAEKTSALTTGVVSQSALQVGV